MKRILYNGRKKQLGKSAWSDCDSDLSLFYVFSEAKFRRLSDTSVYRPRSYLIENLTLCLRYRGASCTVELIDKRDTMISPFNVITWLKALGNLRDDRSFSRPRGFGSSRQDGMDFQVRRSRRRSRAAHQTGNTSSIQYWEFRAFRVASFSRRPHAPELRDVVSSSPLLSLSLSLSLFLSPFLPFFSPVSLSHSHSHFFSRSRFSLFSGLTSSPRGYICS